ncbi:MAG: hypothetical protein ACXQS1_02670 [Methermicoccaceae archaeon]
MGTDVVVWYGMLATTLALTIFALVLPETGRTIVFSLLAGAAWLAQAVSTFSLTTTTFLFNSTSGSVDTLTNNISNPAVAYLFFTFGIVMLVMFAAEYISYIRRAAMP